MAASSTKAKADVDPPTAAPPTSEEDLEDEDGDDGVDDLLCIDGVKPKQIILDGTSIEVKSMSSSSKYTVKRTGDHYYCSCPAWRNQSGNPVNARTCKHLKEVLGDLYEQKRVQRIMGSDYSFPTAGSKKRAKKSVDVATKKAKSGDDLFEVLLAGSWEPSKQDVTGWWISEKLDGVRAVWDPQAQTFYSRTGNVYMAPKTFTKGLPSDVTLDGELFCGRRQFQSTVSIVRTSGSKKWGKVRYHIFDVPSMGEEPFEARMKWLRDWFKRSSKELGGRVVIVEQRACESNDHLLEELAKMDEAGGEGLMLRKPASKYERGRSSTLLKVKTFHDAEAEVIAHETGQGRNAQVVGALKCRMEDGKIFKVGTGLTGALRKNPPAIGCIITYKFQELTDSGVPRFPSFVRVHPDLKKARDYRPGVTTDAG